jgi:hypothetical protein
MISFNSQSFITVQARQGVPFQGRRIDMTNLKEQIRRGNRDKVDEILSGADRECFKRHSTEISEALKRKSDGDDDWRKKANDVTANARKDRD